MNPQLIMKHNVHSSSKQLLNAPQMPNQQDSRIKSSLKGKQGPQNGEVKYYQNHPFSKPKVQQSPVYPLRNYQQFSRAKYRQFSKSSAQRDNTVDYVSTEHITALQQRLRNIHDHYKLLIEEVKIKNQEKGEVIMDLLEQMQVNHNEKLMAIKKMIEDNDLQKKQVGFVDDKMLEIKGNIDDLIQQSNQLKNKNLQLEHKITEKTNINGQKQKDLEGLNQELLEARTELEQFQLTNLKKNKINREILEIFNSASTIAE